MSMEPKKIEFVVKGISTDITEEINGYSKIFIESVYGDLWLF